MGKERQQYFAYTTPDGVEISRTPAQLRFFVTDEGEMFFLAIPVGLWDGGRNWRGERDAFMERLRGNPPPSVNPCLTHEQSLKILDELNRSKGL